MEQKIYVEKIRNNYTEKQVTKFDELKELNKKVNRPAQVGAYLFGSASALVLGTGMCFAMKVIGTLDQKSNLHEMYIQLVISKLVHCLMHNMVIMTLVQ